MTARLLPVSVLILGAAAAAVALREPLAPKSAAVPEAVRFLERYMEPDGRVVRRGEGGDTVSEGQAYAMLLAAATGDRRSFDLAWGWARAHLRRPDGLLSWLWRDGRVADPEPAADADLDAARALLVGARRFGEQSYRTEARRIAEVILRAETVRAGDELVLVAGPWSAREERPVVNPSYLSPRAFSDIQHATGDSRWADVAASGLSLMRKLTSEGRSLPPDWAVLAQDGRPLPVGDPKQPGSRPRFGPDAARSPVRLAESCDRDARDLAAAWWPKLQKAVRESGVASSLDLEGRVLARDAHAAGLVGAAASAGAAGRLSSRRDLLERAAAADRRDPGYYGAAWVALGRVMLASRLLGECP